MGSLGRLLSKCYGLAGLRVGYLHAPSHEAFERVVNASHVGDTAFGATTLSQIAAIAGLTQSGRWFDAFKAHLTEARALICDRLDTLEGLSCTRPEATYLASPQLITEAWRPELTSEQMTAALLNHARLTVVPGSPRFFSPRAEGLIRLSFATSLGLIDESMSRIERAWPQLRTLYGA